MQAVILAGGLGTRLRTIVSDRPKPMVEIAGRPFLEYQLDFLKKYGITELVFCVGYLREHIQAYFGSGEKWGATINYAQEKELLGTGGALKNAQALLGESFFVLNGDSFFDFDLSAFLRFHQRKISEHPDCLGSMALVEVPDARSYGAVTLAADGRIVRFEEKSEKPMAAHTINAGIYLLEHEALQHIPPLRKTSLERETFPALVQSGRVLFGYVANGFFVDIGTPSGLQAFQQRFQGRWAT